jgi:hypothetical protein
MTKTTSRWFGRSLVAVAALSGACAGDAPVSPAAVAPAAMTGARDGDGRVDLASCTQLAAPEGSTLVLKAFGVGVQIYHWDGTSWGVAVPSATLYADGGENGVVADHFGGPTWKSNSGGTVVGRVADRCTPDAASIAWLALTGFPEGAGVFAKVTFIQRLHTVGGNAPSTPGSTIGAEARVPYTADYLFYQAP